MNQNNSELSVIGKNLGAKKLDKNDPEFQFGVLAMKTEAGRTTNHAASST